MADNALTTRPPRWAAASGGIDKAAILLMTLGPEAAGKVLQHLSDQEVRQLSEAMTRLRSIRRDHAAAVHEEAWRWLTNREGFLVDGEQFVHKLLESRAAAGAKTETQMMRELRARKAGEQTLAE